MVSEPLLSRSPETQAAEQPDNSFVQPDSGDNGAEVSDSRNAVAKCKGPR